VAVDPFAEAETRYRSLVDQRRNGGLQARAFRLAVRDLAVLDSEGHRWMLGPEDGVWYRREHERWLQADPPRRLVCTHCGHQPRPPQLLRGVRTETQPGVVLLWASRRGEIGP